MVSCIVHIWKTKVSEIYTPKDNVQGRENWDSTNLAANVVGLSPGNWGEEEMPGILFYQLIEEHELKVRRDLHSSIYEAIHVQIPCIKCFQH
jgi:hypothetical protein